jgi:hypothetical protein
MACNKTCALYLWHSTAKILIAAKAAVLAVMFV